MYLQDAWQKNSETVAVRSTSNGGRKQKYQGKGAYQLNEINETELTLV